MKITLNTVLLLLILVMFLMNFVFTKPVVVSPYTVEDIERAERSAAREAEIKALKELISINEQIIKEDERVIDSTSDFVSKHYREKRDSLRAIAFKR